MKEIFVGIDVGGTNIKFGCFDSEMSLLCKRSIPTDAGMGPDAVIDAMAQTISELLSEQGLSLEDVKGVGLGTPGPANYKEGIIINATNMPKFKNVALGTGIGGGIIVDGELVHGFDGNGAELGHLIIYPGGRLCNCGQRGCVEAYASASWTAVRAQETVEEGTESSLREVLKVKGEITCKDVYEHLESGDGLAKKITDETAEALALVCVNMLHTTEPKRIVFSGGMIAAGDVLLNRIKDYFDEYVWNLKEEKVEICFATLGEDAGIAGAAALAKHSQQKSVQP